MNRLGIPTEKVQEYIEKCKDSIKKSIEIKEAIERRGEIYPGELQLALDNIKTYEDMLRMLEANRN